MWGTPMREDGSTWQLPSLHFSQQPATGVKEQQKRCGVLCASRHEAPENFDAVRLVQPLSFSAVIVSCPGKPASRFIHSYEFGVVLSWMSSRLRGRPPFFPM